MRRGEQGYALVVLLVGILAGLALLSGGMSHWATRSAISKQRASLVALHDAKTALIAYSMLDENTPGSLPCPAPVAVEPGGETWIKGEAGSCDDAAQPLEVLGRFPWKTLGIEPPIDGSNECLWYAIHYPFRNSIPNDQRGGTSAINPQNAALNGLVVKAADSSIPNSKAMAVLFAPGVTLDGKAKTASQLSSCNLGAATAFLDATSTVDNSSASGTVVSGPASTTFNDQVLPLSSNDILRPTLRHVLQQLNQTDVRTWLRAVPSDVTLADARAADKLNFDKKVLAPASILEIPITTYIYPNGSCPSIDSTGASLKYPVFSLCYNGWYDLISLNTTTQKLSLSLGNGSSYACQLDFSTGKKNSGTVICG